MTFDAVIEGSTKDTWPESMRGLYNLSPLNISPDAEVLIDGPDRYRLLDGSWDGPKAYATGLRLQSGVIMPAGQYQHSVIELPRVIMLADRQWLENGRAGLFQGDVFVHEKQLGNPEFDLEQTIKTLEMFFFMDATPQIYKEYATRSAGTFRGA